MSESPAYPLRVSQRLLITIFLSQSLFSAAQIAILTLHSIAAGILGGSDAAAGMPTTVVTFSHSLFAYSMGLIMGRFGRRMGLLTAYGFGLLGALLGLVAVLNGWFALLLISSAGMGIARSGSQMSRFVVGEIFPVGRRAQMIGRVVFAGTIGAVFGPALVAPSSRLAQFLGLEIPFEPALAQSPLAQIVMPHANTVGELTTGPWVIASFLLFISTLITWLLLRPEPALIARQYSEAPSPSAKAGGGDRLRDLLRLPNVQLAILSMVICQTVMSTLMTITPWHMHLADHENAQVSLVIGVHVFGMFGLSPLTGYLIDRYGRVSMMVIAALILIASTIIAPLSTQMPYLLAGLFLLGLGWNFGYVAGSSMLADALSGANRTRVAGFNDTLVAFCAGLGTLSSGFLFGLGGFLFVSLGGGALALALLGLIRRLTLRQLALQPS
ncbi:MAG: MFS transporter [Chloroflexi bacterium]|nr:MFS transporter [Chloroflexota bacterium]MYA94562.1 MFS transporter [Chloroflexota bacterium]MYD39140.1 MFS transporter [Chloroflexota bacterium]MYE79102.1 MFS transporter [Chloroflexota bacterium]